MFITTGLPRYCRVTFDRPNEGEGGDVGDTTRVIDNQPDSTDDHLDNFIAEGDRVDENSSSTQDDAQAAQGEGTQPSAQGQQGDSGRTGEDQRSAQQRQQESAGSPQDLRLQDGTVIPGGLPRRLYEQREQARRELSQVQQQTQQMQQQLQAAQAQVQAFERASSAPQQLGLTPQEVHVGHQVIAAFKKDPVATINYLLTEAKAAGHNTDMIGGGVDTAAIQRIIEQQLAPITNQHRAQQQQEQTNQQAQQQAQQFFNNFPDAQTHENELAQLISRDPSLTPETAYYALQNYFLRNGLDWSKPLSEQQGGEQQPQQQQRSLPGRAGGGGSNTPSTPFNPNRPNGEIEGWDDIVRGALRESGLHQA